MRFQESRMPGNPLVRFDEGRVVTPQDVALAPTLLANLLCFLVFGGMQAAGAGAERDVAVLGVVVERGAAVPQAGAAVNALLAIEDGDAAGTGRDGLAGGHLDAHFG